MFAGKIDTWSAAVTRKRFLNHIKHSARDGYHLLELERCFIRYRVAGNGSKTLVLATDPPISLECYDQLLSLLSRDYRVYVFELPGFGYSLIKRNFRFDFESTIETLYELLTRWNKGPYTLAFPCASAFFSIALANRYSDLISHLSLIQSPNWEQEQAWKQRLDPHHVLNRPFVGQLFLKWKKRDVARQWIKFASNTEAFTQNSTALVNQQLHHGGCYCLASAMQYGLPAQSPELTQVQQPARLIIGGNDRSHRGTDFHTIRDYGDRISIHPIQQAGHFPELEAPEQFKQLVDELHQSHC